MNKSLIISLIIIVIIILLVWAPWITGSYAERKVSQKFNEKWEGVMDGCGFNCDDCGVKESHRTFFGYSVKIEYECGMKVNNDHQIKDIFVSLFGTIHGI